MLVTLLDANAAVAFSDCRGFRGFHRELHGAAVAVAMIGLELWYFG